MNSIKKIPTLLLLGLCIITCFTANSQNSQSYYEKVQIQNLQIPDAALSFFVVGDWGRNGDFNQQQVADRMAEAAYKIEPEFFISTGDNFYSNGVAGINDPMWQTSFENVYHHGTLFEYWYVVLGNHDYRGNPQAQLDYTNVSQRWQMPARYYSFEQELEDESGETALFVFIDSSPFEKDYYQEEKYKNVLGQDTIAQKLWLEKTLSTSKAKWKVVIGHHPLYTTGKRFGERNDMIPAFQPLFEKYKVDAYFAGHEHDLQHQKPEGIYTNHFVSGAGSEVRPIKTRLASTKFAESMPGFMAVSVTQSIMLIQVVNNEGQVIYETMVEKK